MRVLLRIQIGKSNDYLFRAQQLGKPLPGQYFYSRFKSPGVNLNGPLNAAHLGYGQGMRNPP